MQNKDKGRTTVTLSSKVYLELDALKYELKKQEGSASMDSTVLSLLEDRKTLEGLRENTEIPLKTQISTQQESSEIERLKKELLSVLTLLEDKKTLNAINTDNSNKLSKIEFRTDPAQSIEIERLKKELLIKQMEIENLKEKSFSEESFSEESFFPPEDYEVKKIRSGYKNWKGSRAKFLAMIDREKEYPEFQQRIDYYMINPALFVILDNRRFLGSGYIYEHAKEYICDLLSKRPLFKLLRENGNDFEL